MSNFSLFSFSLLLNIILDVGITNFNNRNISQNQHLLSKYFPHLVVLKFFLAVVYALVCLIVSFFIGYDERSVFLLIFLIINQFILSMIMYFRSNISGLHLFKTDSFISILDKLIMILICSALMWGNITDKPFCIEWFVYTQTVAYFVTAIVSFLIVVRQISFKHFIPSVFHFRFDWRFLLVILKQSYPFALLILLMTFYNRIDSVMLERMLVNGDEQAGIYAQSYRILEAVSMFAYLFAGLLLPIFSRMIKMNQSVNELVKLSFLLLIVPAIIVAVISCTFSENIITLLYVHYHPESSLIFGLLILSLISVSTTYIFGTLLTAKGNMRHLNIMATIGMTINILLNLLLIPRLQALGTAIASIITQLFTALVQFWLSKKVFHFNVNFRKSIPIFSFLISTILISIACKYIISNWLIAMSISAIGSFAIAIILKLFDIKTIFMILKEK